MADHPLPVLRGKTPLQAAHTPTLDKLASQHIGQANTTPSGFSPGTENAIPLLLGYDISVLTGRGPVEAAGMGIALQQGQWAMRMNLVTLDNDDILRDACPEPAAETIAQSMDILLHDAAFNAVLTAHNVQLYKQPTFRQMLVGSATQPTAKPTPPHNVLGAKYADHLTDDPFISQLMQAARKPLSRLPFCNAVWPWGCGVVPNFENFQTRYGLRGACIASVPVLHGISRLCGLDVIEHATHGHAPEKAQLTTKTFEAYDFVLLHIETPDDCSHAMDLDGKIAAIQAVDNLAKTILDGMSDSHLRILLCSDHYTCVTNGQHDSTPTPYCVWDSTTPSSNSAHPPQEGNTGSFDEFHGEIVSGNVPLAKLLEV